MGNAGARLLLNSQVWDGTEENKMNGFYSWLRPTVENGKLGIHLPCILFLRVGGLCCFFILQSSTYWFYKKLKVL